MVAALDRRVRCVVSQVPLVSGLANARRLIRADVLAVLRQMFDADRAARYAGKEPGTIQVVWDKEPTEACALPTEDSHDFFLGPILERATAWRNEVTLRSVEMFIEYEPGAYIADISPTPLMMVVAAKDHSPSWTWRSSTSSGRANPRNCSSSRAGTSRPMCARPSTRTPRPS